MKNQLKSSLVVAFMLLSFIACNSSNDDCENEVSVEKVGTEFVQLRWSHSCMSCEKWEIKYDRNCFFCWFPLTKDVNTGGNAFQGNVDVISGLNSNTNYKATIYSVGSPVTGQPCVREKIGKVTFRTN